MAKNKTKKTKSIADELGRVRFICTSCLKQVIPKLVNVSVINEPDPYNLNDNCDGQVIVYLKCHDERKLFYLNRNEVTNLVKAGSDILFSSLKLEQEIMEIGDNVFKTLSKYSERLEALSVMFMQEFEFIQNALQDGCKDRIFKLKECNVKTGDD
jgi:hypothetical protein